MPRELTTAELFGQAGMQVPTPADLPALTESLKQELDSQSVVIEYTVNSPVNTNTVLSVGYRLLADSVDLKRVLIRRVGGPGTSHQVLTIEIVLEKQRDYSIKETFTAIQPAS